MGADSYVTGKVAFDQFFRIRHAPSGFWLHYAPVPGSEAAPLLASRVMHDQDVFGLQARDLSPSPDPSSCGARWSRWMDRPASRSPFDLPRHLAAL